jgi:hypothetical protein
VISAWEAELGEVIRFSEHEGLRRRRSVPTEAALILFFTGVRYSPPVDVPAPRKKRVRGGRAKARTDLTA